MRLPNGEKAFIADDKLQGFLLNEDHPEQPGHAILFRQLLGLGPADTEMLRSSLLRAAAEDVATPGHAWPYGSKYEVRFQMTGPRGAYTVLSVWIIEHGDDRPRLVTAYIE